MEIKTVFKCFIFFQSPLLKRFTNTHVNVFEDVFVSVGHITSGPSQAISLDVVRLQSRFSYRVLKSKYVPFFPVHPMSSTEIHLVVSHSVFDMGAFYYSELWNLVNDFFFIELLSPKNSFLPLF